MSLTPEDINAMLGDYMKSPEGKKYLKDSGLNVSGYSEQEMKAIAAELRDALVNAYLGVVKDPGKYFDVKLVRINPPREQKDGTWKLILSFPEKTLFRRSLYSDFGTSKKGTSSGFTGSGVTDIWALFSMGYSAKASVWGTWWDNQTDSGDRGELGIIRSRRSRTANPFISNTIRIFMAKYPEINIQYPSEWGGTL